MVAAFFAFRAVVKVIVLLLPADQLRGQSDVGSLGGLRMVLLVQTIGGIVIIIVIDTLFFSTRVVIGVLQCGILCSTTIIGFIGGSRSGSKGRCWIKIGRLDRIDNGWTKYFLQVRSVASGSRSDSIIHLVLSISIRGRSDSTIRSIRMVQQHFMTGPSVIGLEAGLLQLA